MSQPQFSYELFASVLATLEINDDVIVGGNLGFQSKAGDRIVRRKKCDWNDHEMVVFSRALGTIVHVQEHNGRWTFRDTSGDGVVYDHTDPVQVAEIVRQWPDVSDDVRQYVERAATAYTEYRERTARKWAAVQAAAKAEAKATGHAVAYADCYVGCGNVATRWNVATPDGRLEAAVTFYVGPNKVYGEGYLSHRDARKAVASYDAKRWAAAYAAA